MASVKLEESPNPLNWRASALRGLPIILVLAGGLFCYGLFYNRGLGLQVIGYSVAPAERVLQGEVPYRDFLFNYTPGILWVNALLMKAFGVTLMATRIGLFLFKMATLLALYYVGQRLMNKWAALVPVALTLSWPGHLQLFSVYPDQYLMLFALIGLVCMLNYDQTNRSKWLLLCGLATGTAFLFKYNVGVLLAASSVVIILVREMMTSRRRIVAAVNAVSVYVGGFAIVAAALAAYLAYNHAFTAMVNHFLHYAAEYSETRSVSFPSPLILLPSAAILLPPLVIGLLILLGSGRVFVFYWIAVLIGETWLVLQQRQGRVRSDSLIAWAAYFPPLIFAVSPALAIWLLKTQTRETWWRDNAALAITGLFVLSIYLEVYPRADYYHMFRVLPPVFLFCVALLHRCFPAVRGLVASRVRSPRLAALLICAAPLLFLSLAGVRDAWLPQFESGFHLKDDRELAVERGRGILVDDRQAELAEGLVRLVQDNSSPDDYIFSFARRGSGLYFLAARKNPTRFLWWNSVGISADERDALRTMIRERRAKLVIAQDDEANDEIQQLIDLNYEPIGKVIDISVYAVRNGAAANHGGQASLAAASATGSRKRAR